MTPKTPAPFLLIALVALLAISFSWSKPATADLPTLRDNGDASRTVSWAMDNPQNLTLQDIQLVGGRAVLPWQSRNMSWDRSAQFVQNGTLDANLTSDASGISLLADLSNHIADGEFGTDSPWRYEDSAGGNVTARWDSIAQDTVFRHSSQSTQVLWDGLNSTTNWESSASSGLGTLAGIWENRTGQIEGSGMLGLDFTLGSDPAQYAAAQRTITTDWSSYDRLILWVKTLNVNSPLTFNVTERVGTALHGTVPQPLALGWQEIVVDLNQFGPTRSSLQNLSLQINGRNIPLTTVYFDDVRIANAKDFDETAMVAQSLLKTTATSASSGSAILTFDWTLSNMTGVVAVTGTVNLSGPSGIFLQDFSATVLGEWVVFRADASPETSAPGSYNLTILVRVTENNTVPSEVAVRVDNVSLVFPNRHNGTYFSNPISLGTPSEYQEVSWGCLLPTSTSGRLSARTGNDTNPSGAGWSAWQNWTVPGTSPMYLPGAKYFQIRVELGTTDASVSPTLVSISVETRHRVAQGSVVSGIFTAPADVPFLHWQTIRAEFNTTAKSLITFSVGNGAYRALVAPGADLSSFTEPSMQWEARLTTSSGLETPELERVELVYEYLGPITNVYVWPGGIVNVTSGSWIVFHAAALDAGSHVVSAARFDWWTDDPRGRVFNNGSYLAGEPGLHNVTATVVGFGISETVQVKVIATTSALSGPPYVLYGLGIAAAAGLGYAVYEFAIRRMFSIDDVFLISRDGRLLMHNTRRMRADRDEDILSGMLTAITTFVRDAEWEENGELRRFDIGGKTTLLERGENVYLAAVYSGRVPAWAGKDLARFLTDLEDHFGLEFENWSGAAEDLQGLKEFTGRFVTRMRYRSAKPRRAS